MLGITPPAVSQYVSKKRGYNIEFREDIRQSIAVLAEDLIAGNVEGNALVPRICKICRMLQDDEAGHGASEDDVEPSQTGALVGLGRRDRGRFEHDDRVELQTLGDRGGYDVDAVLDVTVPSAEHAVADLLAAQGC